MKQIIVIAALALPAWVIAQTKPANPQAKPAPKQSKKKAPPKPDASKANTEEALMPSLSRSPTGYVEDAAVGTQIRVRFDAGFGIQSPDRAEFFYGKCGCYRATGDDLRAPGPDSRTGGPVVVTNLRFQETHINLEYGFNRRFSFFVDGGARSIQPQKGFGWFSNQVVSNPFGSQTGPGDVQAGFKFAAIASRAGYLTFQLRSYFPTGNALLGLGTDHYTIEPAVLFMRTVAPRTSLSGQFSVWHPIQGSNSAGASADRTQSFAGNVLTYGLGVSHRYQVSENVRVAPVVEFVGWSIRSGFVTLFNGTPSASGENILNGKAGVRFYVDGRNSFYVGFGRQLSHIGWYRDFMRVEYARYF